MDDIEAMPERLAAFLRERTGRSVTVESYVPMTGGYSRLMARADVIWDDGSDERLVVRGDPPAGQALMETDRDQEWALITALTAAGTVPMPAARWYDDTGETLGTKAIILDFCPGPSFQQVLDTCAGEFGEHPLRLAEIMGHLHTSDRSVVDGVLPAAVDWGAHMADLVGAFAAIEASAHEAEPVLRYAAGFLGANLPPPLPLTIVHGDFQSANMMVDEQGSHLLVDWELCHIGDPREDLGYYNIYSSSSGPNLYASDPEAFLDRYREVTGFDAEAVNQATVGYFSSIAAVKLWGQILAGAGAMAEGSNSGIMTTYTINALSIGRQNFLLACDELGV